MKIYQLKLLPIPIFLMAILGVLTSCSVSKNVTTKRENTDSLVQAIIDSSKHKFIEQAELHKKEIKELQESSVKFQDPPKCPPTIIDSNCDKDSMVKVIRDLEKIIANQKNTVKFYKDGSFEAQGQISEANFKADKWSKELDSVGLRNEELSRQVNLLNIELSKAKSEKQKEKKTLWLPWWLVLAIVIGSFISWHHRAKVWKFFSFKKSNNMKLLFIVAACLLMASCGHFHDEPTKSVWAEGGWLVFWLPFVGSVLSFISAYSANKEYGKSPTKGLKQKRLGFLFFGILCLLFAIGVVIYFNSPSWR